MLNITNKSYHTLFARLGHHFLVFIVIITIVSDNYLAEGSSRVGVKLGIPPVNIFRSLLGKVSTNTNFPQVRIGLIKTSHLGLPTIETPH